MKKGIFITVEGPNGVGKSTFIYSLSRLLGQEYSIYTTKEPTESGFGEYVKQNAGGPMHTWLRQTDVTMWKTLYSHNWKKWKLLSATDI